MKKSDIALLAGVVLIIIIALLVNVGKDLEKVKVVGEKGLYQLTYSEYEQLIKDEEPFLVVIERTGCTYCEKYMPVLESITSSMNIGIYYVDIATLSEEESSKLTSSNNYLSSNEWGTPTTLLLKGKEDLASISGYVDERKLEEFINKYIDLSEETEENIEMSSDEVNE